MKEISPEQAGATLAIGMTLIGFLGGLLADGVTIVREVFYSPESVHLDLTYTLGLGLIGLACGLTANAIVNHYGIRDN